MGALSFFAETMLLFAAQAGPATELINCAEYKVVITKEDGREVIENRRYCEDAATGNLVAAPLKPIRRRARVEGEPSTIGAIRRGFSRRGAQTEAGSERSQATRQQRDQLRRMIEMQSDSDNAPKPATAPKPAVEDKEALLAQLDDLNAGMADLRSGVDELDELMSESARQGRELLRCDDLARIVRKNLGDPERGDRLEPIAFEAMPKQVAQSIDDCADMRHGYLNAISGLFRITGLPLGRKSRTEAFDYFLNASKWGYPYGADLAAFYLLEEGNRSNMTEEQVERLAQEYERQGKDASDLRAASAAFLRSSEKLSEARAERIRFCNVADSLLRKYRRSSDPEVKRALQRKYNELNEPCREVSISLTRP